MESTIISRLAAAAGSGSLYLPLRGSTFRGFFALFLWLMASHASAAAYSLAPGGPLPEGCTSSSATSYSCSNLAMGWNDTLSVANPNTTLTVTGTFTPNGNAINWSGPASGFRINANAISGTQFLNLNGALHVTGNLTLGNGQISGNVSTNGSATVGGTITGALTATGAVSTAFNTKITGAISGASFSSGGGSTYGGGITVTGGLALGHGDTVTGNVSAGTTASINGTINGTLTAGGAITSAWNTKVTGAVKGSTFSGGGGGVYSGGIEATSSGVTLGSSDTVTGNIKAKGAVSLGSSASASGNVITTGTVALGSSAQVGGDISAGGLVSLGHATRVGGDVTTSDKDGVTIASSDARVTGCVRVPKDGNKKNITLGWHAVVGGVCCRPGNSAQCQDSCVENDSGYAMPPLCTAMPPSEIDPLGFNCVEPGSDALTGRIYTKLAGTGFSLNIAALKDTNGDGVADGVETSYASDQNRTVTVELVDGSGDVSCPSRTPLSPAVSASLIFLETAQGTDQGRKNVTLTSAGAHRNVMCRVKDLSLNKTGCSTDRFSIRPKEFTISSSMNNSALTGTPKNPAGTAFTLTADAGVTSGYDGTPTLVPARVNDHQGIAIATGTLSGDFGAGTGAGATGSNFKYYDVGSIQLAKDAVVDSGFMAGTDDLTNEDCVEGSASNTLADGKYGCNIGSQATAKFGRWHPSHYSFSGTLTPSCPPNHTYMGEDNLKVKLTVKAHVLGPGTPDETDPVASRYTYDASNWVAEVTFSGDNDGTPVSLARLADPAFPDMPNKGLWSNGQFAIDETYQFTRSGTPDGPYDQFKIVAAVNDPDGATLITPKETNATRLRHGRLVVGNAHGSELIALPVGLTAQYWDGSTWKLNTADSCSPINPKAIVFSGWSGGLGACETGFPVSPAVTLNAGKGQLTLSRPGANNGGSVQLFLAKAKPPASPDDKTCLAATDTQILDADVTAPWFGTENQAGRITFGTHKAPLIDRRERY